MITTTKGRYVKNVDWRKKQIQLVYNETNTFKH